MLTSKIAGVLGHRLRRADGPAKVTGSAIYAIDYAEPHMLHAKILRSPVSRGRITRLDVSKAEAMPGVYAVCTAADAPHRAGWFLQDQVLMAGDLIRFAGEPIAAVAAETIMQATAAVRAIELEVEELPAITDLLGALADDAPAVHPDLGEYAALVDASRGGNVAWESTLVRGDVDAAFEAADVTVEDEFTVGRQHQLYLEPRAAVARYENGRYVIHTSTQVPFNVRNRVAEFLGTRPSQVRVVVTAVGGGFGGKVDATVEPFCALLARKSERPVKLVNTRREEFISGNPRENSIIRIRSALTSNGRILAREADCLIDNGAYSGEMPLAVALPGFVIPFSYRAESVRIRSRLVYTNTAPTGAFRGIGQTQFLFALERHVDNICHVLEVDRREFRLRHLYRSGDKGPSGQPLADVPLDEAFQRIEERAPWKEVSKKRPYHGVGIACGWGFTTGGPTSVLMKLNEDGTIGVITGATEIGTGAIAAGAIQLIAAEIGVRPEDVVLLPTDTDAAPFDLGAQGSRTAFSVGKSVHLAAEDLRTQVFEVASQLLEVSPGDLELVDGTVRTIGAPSKAVPLATVAQTATWTAGPIAGRGKYLLPPDQVDAGCLSGSLFASVPTPNYHVHLAEVDVDPNTGKVTLSRYIVAQDVGFAINPTMIEGQIHGGVLQGVGYALYEELRMRDGVYVDTSLETYRVPTALEAPPIEIELLEHASEHGLHGAKGVGEPTIIPVAPAIACAVADAIGVSITRLPITPFDVLAALRARAGA